MSAAEHLSRIQFLKADEGEDKHAERDRKGQDEDASYGYSAEDLADYQYERYGKDETETNPRREVI